MTDPTDRTPTDAQQDGRQDTDRPDATRRDRMPTVDLAPLTDLIDDLTRRNADLAAAAAMWQTRAAHLENQLLQLTASTTDSDTEPEPNTVDTEGPQLLQESDPARREFWAWWKRLWGG